MNVGKARPGDLITTRRRSWPSIDVWKTSGTSALSDDEFIVASLSETDVAMVIGSKVKNLLPVVFGCTIGWVHVEDVEFIEFV